MLTSTTAYLASRAVCSKADVVLVKARDGVNFGAGQVWFLASTNGITCALVSLWDFVYYDPVEGLAIWRKDDRPDIVELDSLMTSVAWSECGGTVRTLIPSEFRGLRAMSAQ